MPPKSQLNMLINIYNICFSTTQQLPLSSTFCNDNLSMMPESSTHEQIVAAMLNLALQISSIMQSLPKVEEWNDNIIQLSEENLNENILLLIFQQMQEHFSAAAARFSSRQTTKWDNQIERFNRYQQLYQQYQDIDNIFLPLLNTSVLPKGNNLLRFQLKQNCPNTIPELLHCIIQFVNKLDITSISAYITHEDMTSLTLLHSKIVNLGEIIDITDEEKYYQALSSFAKKFHPLINELKRTAFSVELKK